jgi:hypothetical protein
MTWYRSMGHNGPVLRPRCIGTERARTQLLFNSKHQAINVTRERTKLVTSLPDGHAFSTWSAYYTGRTHCCNPGRCFAACKGNTGEARGKIRISVCRISTARTSGHGVAPVCKHLLQVSV